MIEQPVLFDLVPPSEDSGRVWCPFCHANWGVGMERVSRYLRLDHLEAEPGRCASMVRYGITEPYYERTETPWREGYQVTYPRPVGFRGLEQLRSKPTTT